MKTDPFGSALQPKVQVEVQTRLQSLFLLNVQGSHTPLRLMPGSITGIWTLKWSHMDGREEGFL